MSRDHDGSDAEFERRYPQSKRGMPLWAILLIVFGAIGLFGCLGTAALGFFGWSFRAAPPAGPPPVANMGPPPQMQPVLTRAEFERAVLGKTAAEMKAAVGEPIQEGGLVGEETWTYNGRTSDPATGQTDEVTEVVFHRGKAVRVNYPGEHRPGGVAPNALAPDVVATLDGAGEVEVLSLDPMKPKDKPKDDFHGYKVLGRTAVKKGDGKAILDALHVGLKESDGGLADTFAPRHGLRATHDGKTAELVIDFGGRAMQAFVGGKSAGVMSTTAGPQKVFDKALTDAKVPLAAKPEKK